MASRAIEAGLTKGNENFVGTRAATREEACLYAVNALKATLVEYETRAPTSPSTAPLLLSALPSPPT